MKNAPKDLVSSLIITLPIKLTMSYSHTFKVSLILSKDESLFSVSVIKAKNLKTIGEFLLIVLNC
jgi:hypothetical protein